MLTDNNSKLIAIDALLEEKMLSYKGKEILLDKDVADLLGISLVKLHRMARTNKERFPKDFMSGFAPKQFKRCFGFIPQTRRKIYIFYWGGIIMAAGQTRTQKAIEISIQMIEYYCKQFSVFDLVSGGPSRT